MIQNAESGVIILMLIWACLIIHNARAVYKEIENKNYKTMESQTTETQTQFNFLPSHAVLKDVLKEDVAHINYSLIGEFVKQDVENPKNIEYIVRYKKGDTESYEMAFTAPTWEDPTWVELFGEKFWYRKTYIDAFKKFIKMING